MTGDGWEIVLSKAVERYITAMPEAEGTLTLVAWPGGLWSLVFVDASEEGGIVLVDSQPPQAVAASLWDAWSHALGLREAAITN